MEREDPGTITVLRKPREEYCAMILQGEFDLSCHAKLGSALEEALRQESGVLVDLSEVTFVDGSCVRELALLVSCHGERLVLGVPSREVEVSVAACGMEDVVLFGGAIRKTRTGLRRGAEGGNGGPARGGGPGTPRRDNGSVLQRDGLRREGRPGE